MTPKIAFAVSQDNSFERNFFGQARKYIIYYWNDKQFVFQQEIENPYVNIPTIHINPDYGKKLVEFIKEFGVNVLVSKRFGQNIKIANSDFVPVLTGAKTPEEFIPILQKQMRWIDEELQSNQGNYKLFDLRKGNLKTYVKMS